MSTAGGGGGGTSTPGSEAAFATADPAIVTLSYAVPAVTEDPEPESPDTGSLGSGSLGSGSLTAGSLTAYFGPLGTLLARLS